MDWMYVDPEDSAQQVCQNELGTVSNEMSKVTIFFKKFQLFFYVGSYFEFC